MTPIPERIRLNESPGNLSPHQRRKMRKLLATLKALEAVGAIAPLTEHCPKCLNDIPVIR